jgi:hypothetical protein
MTDRPARRAIIANSEPENPEPIMARSKSLLIFCIFVASLVLLMPLRRKNTRLRRMIQLSPGLFTLRAHDMSSGCAKYRHFHAISPRDRMRAGKPHRRRKKNYSLFLNDLAEAAACKRGHGQAIACYPPDGLQAEGLCWEEKSIHEVTRSHTKPNEAARREESDS